MSDEQSRTAVEIAVEAHEGQTDIAGETYIRHPLRVMEAMDSETECVVAVLHDVLEDTEYTPACLDEEFDEEVREAIEALTKEDGEDYSNR